jgi:hypothetical protein
MTREDIIRMAREAGIRDCTCNGEFGCLERFATLVAAASEAKEREACAKTRAGKPRELKPVGRGAFLDEQQFCFDKGWREGAASVRAVIRARGQA